MIPKPPLGVKPEYILLEHRIGELTRAAHDLIGYAQEVQSHRIPPMYFDYLEEIQRHGLRLKAIYNEAEQYGGLRE